MKQFLIVDSSSPWIDAENVTTDFIALGRPILADKAPPIVIVFDKETDMWNAINIDTCAIIGTDATFKILWQECRRSHKMYAIDVTPAEQVTSI